jgi:hypothetical protein
MYGYGTKQKLSFSLGTVTDQNDLNQVYPENSVKFCSVISKTHNNKKMPYEMIDTGPFKFHCSIL